MKKSAFLLNPIASLDRVRAQFLDGGAGAPGMKLATSLGREDERKINPEAAR